MISLIIIFVASGLLSVSTIFIKKKGVLYFSLSALSLMAIIICGILSANYQNNFGGFSIILIISFVPLFLSFFELKPKEIVKEEGVAEENIEEKSDEKINEKKKKLNLSKAFQESEGRIFESIAFTASSFLVAFAGLYLGKETPFGLLMGIPFAIIGLFLTMLRKNHNPFDLLSNSLNFMSVGFLLGQVLAVVVYSFALPNILYSLSLLVLSGYILATTFTKERRINIILFVTLLLLCITIIFF